MKRASKQIFFSLIFLGIFFLIVVLIWNAVTKKEPTCSDGIQNQQETGIDCGGSCISCELKNIQPIELLGYSVMPLNSGRVALLVHIKNPNETHHASSFFYKISLFDENGYERKTLIGESSIAADAEGYIFNAQAGYSDPKDVKLEITDVTWKSKDAFTIPNVSIHDVTTVVDGSVVRVKGTIENASSFDAKNVHIIAVLGGEYNEDMFASEMVLTRVLALDKQQFSVVFPNDEEIVKRLKTDETRVIVQAE